MENKTSYETALSKLQISINHYMKALNTISEAVEIRKNKGKMDEKSAMLSKEALHKNIISLTEIQQLVLKKIRLYKGYFPIFQNLNNDFADQNWNMDEVDVNFFEVEENIHNYLSYQVKKVPLTYSKVTIKGAEPKKPWLAPNLDCEEK